MYFDKYCYLGRLFTVFEHALYDSTSIRVGCQALNLAGECVQDELDMLGGYSFDGFLDYMVSVLIFDAFEHIMLELPD